MSQKNSDIHFTKTSSFVYLHTHHLVKNFKKFHEFFFMKFYESLSKKKKTYKELSDVIIKGVRSLDPITMRSLQKSTVKKTQIVKVNHPFVFVTRSPCCVVNQMEMLYET